MPTGTGAAVQADSTLDAVANQGPFVLVSTPISPTLSVSLPITPPQGA